MTIEELFSKREISVRSYNICRYANIHTVDELASFYKRNKSFLELRYCGRKSQEELLSICQAYQKKEEDLSHNRENTFTYIVTQLSDNQKEEINNFIHFESADLSVELKNKLSSFLDHDFSVEKMADKILSQEAGWLRKTINIRIEFTWELHTYMEAIKKLIINKLREQKFLEHNTDLDNEKVVLLSKQKDAINTYIELTAAKLSTRTKNALYMYLNGDLSISNFESKLLSKKDLSRIKIRNAGKKTFIELENYVDEIKQFVEEVIKTTNEKELKDIRNEYLLKEKFDAGDVPRDIVRSNSIFLITNYLLDNNLLFNQNHTEVLKKLFKINRNQHMFSLLEISLHVNLSTQSFQQIKDTALILLFRKLEFLKNIDDDLLQKYAINSDSPLIDVTPEQVDTINSLNNTNFTREFIVFILSSYLSDTFSLVGYESDVLLHKVSRRKKRYYWKNFYLINKEIYKHVSFYHFTHDLSRRINSTTKKSYSLNFKKYFSRFLFSDGNKYFELLYPIAKLILKEEFDLEPDQDGEIHFERNTYKEEFEYAYGALESIGRPSHLNVIYEKVKELYPEFKTNKERLKETMRTENGFRTTDNVDVFGLRVWQEEASETFKDVSIREIAEEFLHQFDTPQHISDIAEYILLHKPNVKIEYLMTNLRQDKMRKFIFYKDSKVGLSSNNYKKLVKNNELLENKK